MLIREINDDIDFTRNHLRVNNKIKAKVTGHESLVGFLFHFGSAVKTLLKRKKTTFENIPSQKAR